jgi:hypothetical protein
MAELMLVMISSLLHTDSGNMKEKFIKNAVLAYYAVHAGIAARREPSGLSEEDQLRPDLQLLLDQHNLLIRCDYCSPYLSLSLHKPQTQFKTAHQACEAKKSKYKQLAEQQKAEFLPFAIESFGGFCHSARNLIRTIVTFANDYLSAWSKEKKRSSLTSTQPSLVQFSAGMLSHLSPPIEHQRGLVDFSL